MAAAKVYIGASPPGAEVEIAEGLTYTKVTVTKSIQRKLAALDAKQIETDFENDEAVESLIDYFASVYDVILKPLAPNRKKASTFIREQWDSDALSIDQIADHLTHLAEVRPT